MNKKINLIKAILCCCEELIEKSHMLSESETDVTYKEISTLCAKFVKIVQDKVKTPEEYNKFSQIVKSELSTFLKTRAFENYEQNGFYYVGYIAYCYPDALIISFNYLRDSILESSPEFSLEDFSEIEMFVDPSKYAHSIMEATFKDYETLIEFVKFNPKTYRDDSERKEQAIKLCKKIEYKGEEWVLWEPQDRFLVQYLYACFVNTLKILNTQEFCECLDICSTVLAIINYVDLETYLLPEKSAVAEIIDRRLVDKYEADLDELDDKYCNGDFDEEDYDFQDTCYECYSTLVDYFKLDNNMSTCNRRYIIRKAYEFFVERTLIIPEDNFAKDFCLYSDNDSCDIINLFEHEKQTV